MADAPLDMLQKCRAYFSEEAEKYQVAAAKAGSVWERNVATEFGGTARRFVTEIDATLKNWA